jgi:hypothetical protein
MMNYSLSGHRTDTSVHSELKQGFDRWVRGLRPMTQSPKEFPPEVRPRELTFRQSGLDQSAIAQSDR